jgi:urea transport system permease protein
MSLKFLIALVLGLFTWVSQNALALTPELARQLVNAGSDARIEALGQAVNQLSQNPDAPTLALIQALADDAVKFKGDRVYIIRDSQVTDAVTGQEVNLPQDVEEVVNNNRMRGEIDAALASLKLFSKDKVVRAEAIQALASDVDESRLPLIEKALAQETVPDLKTHLSRLRARIYLLSPEVARRLEAAQVMSGEHDAMTKTLLTEQLSRETDTKVQSEMKKALKDIDAALAWSDRTAVVFSGLSLGSILLLVSLGLAITYGLMGVINMAHGELMMMGAYATYVVQTFFQKHWPGSFDAYLLVAIPVSFLASALMGVVLERLVIRFLYGRPLETLLATWGISLMLMQLVRSVFGAQNVGVENPSWMSGGVLLFGNLQLPWNRIFILLFAFMVLVGVALLISKTRLGLFVRGVTQNRAMAACMGVNTARIDTYAFALGSGIAGLAGCALSQIGNVGPDLGQGYIVDSFMVVVLGGVGQLAGTVYAALGLGVLNKFLEGWVGAVLAKIAVLVLIVVFIQKRPQGIFALKGRAAQD